MYYEIRSNIYSDYGVQKKPSMTSKINFIRGGLIPLPEFHEFNVEVNYTNDNPPGPLVGPTSFPMMNASLIEVLQNCGADNLQLFPVRMINPETNQEWDSHQAVNILGMIDCVDMDQSESFLISGSPNDAPPLVDFDEIVIKQEAVMGASIFRIPHSPSTIIVHESIINALKANPYPGGWGISAFPVETV
ncbi:imm11 family protein [Hahella ganghwensis]|uniref:imm11 family protein n=1 Tax=Hahella ganghwensis TaxID=286420 RepID=UPI000475975F|nr:DUF1629 domain-containing protein [Hahella ganghwensis]